MTASEKERTSAGEVFARLDRVLGWFEANPTALETGPEAAEREDKLFSMNFTLQNQALATAAMNGRRLGITGFDIPESIYAPDFPGDPDPDSMTSRESALRGAYSNLLLAFYVSDATYALLPDIYEALVNRLEGAFRLCPGLVTRQAKLVLRSIAEDLADAGLPSLGDRLDKALSGGGGGTPPGDDGAGGSSALPKGAFPDPTEPVSRDSGGDSQSSGVDPESLDWTPPVFHEPRPPGEGDAHRIPPPAGGVGDPPPSEAGPSEKPAGRRLDSSIEREIPGSAESLLTPFPLARLILAAAFLWPLFSATMGGNIFGTITCAILGAYFLYDEVLICGRGGDDAFVVVGRIATVPFSRRVYKVAPDSVVNFLAQVRMGRSPKTFTFEIDIGEFHDWRISVEKGFSKHSPSGPTGVSFLHRRPILYSWFYAREAFLHFWRSGMEIARSLGIPFCWDSVGKLDARELAPGFFERSSPYSRNGRGNADLAARRGWDVASDETSRRVTMPAGKGFHNSSWIWLFLFLGWALISFADRGFENYFRLLEHWLKILLALWVSGKIIESRRFAFRVSWWLVEIGPALLDLFLALTLVVPFFTWGPTLAFLWDGLVLWNLREFLIPHLRTTVSLNRQFLTILPRVFWGVGFPVRIPLEQIRSIVPWGELTGQGDEVLIETTEGTVSVDTGSAGGGELLIGLLGNWYRELAADSRAGGWDSPSSPDGERR